MHSRQIISLQPPIINTEILYSTDVCDLVDSIDSKYGSRQLLFVIDSGLPKVWKSFFQSLDTDSCFFVAKGEQAKTFEQLQALLAHLLAHNFQRSCVLVAVGGGACCDMVAFAASIYKRGCGLVLVPTSLLAMLDASFGGKTAINAKLGQAIVKNPIGSIYPANQIFVISSFLSTLDSSQWLSGYGELVKAYLLLGQYPKIKDLRRFIHSDSGAVIEPIKLALDYKISIVKKDLHDTLGIRNCLNFGHTVAHVLEALTKSSITHGQAVLWGMLIELYILKEQPSAQQYIKEFIKEFEIVCPAVVGKEKQILSLLRSDKKATSENIVLVIPSGSGKTTTHMINAESFAKDLAACLLNPTCFLS